MRHAIRLALALSVVCGTTAGARQTVAERLILFEDHTERPNPEPRYPGEIREIELTDGGRGWSEIARVSIPAHTARTQPVALADGRRIMWLVDDEAGGSLLAQYDRATYRASVVDVGRFSPFAMLVADRPRARVFVVEPARVVAIDERFQRFVVDLPRARLLGANIGDGTLLLRRYDDQANAAELLVIDTATGAVQRVALDANRLGGHATVSRDARRLFVASLPYGAQHFLNVYALPTGELLSRAPNVAAVETLELDEARGVIISDLPDHTRRWRVFQVRDARTLALVGEFGLGLFDHIRATMTLATGRDTLLVFSRYEVFPWWVPASCESLKPRLTIFDRRTFTAVRQIDLQGHCPTVVPLPVR